MALEGLQLGVQVPEESLWLLVEEQVDWTLPKSKFFNQVSLVPAIQKLTWLATGDTEIFVNGVSCSQYL